MVITNVTFGIEMPPFGHISNEKQYATRPTNNQHNDGNRDTPERNTPRENIQDTTEEDDESKGKTITIVSTPPEEISLTDDLCNTKKSAEKFRSTSHSTDSDIPTAMSIADDYLIRLHIYGTMDN